jgi:hypothetical protein
MEQASSNTQTEIGLPATRHACSCTDADLSYEGQYVEGQMNGLGVYRWANGRHVQELLGRIAS